MVLRSSKMMVEDDDNPTATSSVDSIEDSDDTSSDSSADSESDSGEESSAEEASAEVSFPSAYSILDETAVSVERNFICHLCGSSQQKKIGLALSDRSLAVYDLNNLKRISKHSGHTGTITNIRFNPADHNLVLSSSTDGTIKVWDTRKEGKNVLTFQDDSLPSGGLKPLLSFDVSCNGQFVCGGTELVDGDAYLDFWDARSTKLLGAYWESHNDDITQVCYHPSLSDVVISGSTDGLINIFDLNKSNEDDALLYSLNTESSVDKATWVLLDGAVKAVSCITHTMDVQIWEQDGASPLMSFLRKDISKAVKGNSDADCYSVDIHQIVTSGDVMLLTGSSEGRGEGLHLMNITDKRLTPRAKLAGNKQIVRSSWYHQEANHLVTAGESGILTVWRPAAEHSTSVPGKLKVSAKQSGLRAKPY